MFCGIKRLVPKLLCTLDIENLIEGTLNDDLELRRFGINTSGVITYDDFGEPVDLDAQVNYLSSFIKGKVEWKTLEDWDNSNIGGESSPREYLQVIVATDLDIKIGDVLIYPIDSGDSYRVDKDRLDASAGRRIIIAIDEKKITR